MEQTKLNICLDRAEKRRESKREGEHFHDIIQRTEVDREYSLRTKPTFPLLEKKPEMRTLDEQLPNNTTNGPPKKTPDAEKLNFSLKIKKPSPF